MQLVAQAKCGRLADLLAQTNDCLRHLSQRLSFMSSHSNGGGGGSGSRGSRGGGEPAGTGVQFGSSSDDNADEAEAWARRMVFDADVAAPPRVLQAELRPYQMKVGPAGWVMHAATMLPGTGPSTPS
jgi:hypothetical protein